MSSLRFSAGIIPVHSEEELKFLLLRSYNYWDFPKGQVEKDEKILSAAKRELQEETGITHVTFPFGEDFIETEPYSNGKVARYYIGKVTATNVVLGINPELGRPEHQEFRWVSYEEAQKLLGPRVLRVLKWAHEKCKKI